MTNVPDFVPQKDEYVPDGLTKREKEVYLLLKQQPDLTREELAQQIGITVKTVQRALYGLKQKNVISRVGTARKGSWKIEK